MFEGVDDDEEISGEDALLGCDEMKKKKREKEIRRRKGPQIVCVPL